MKYDIAKLFEIHNIKCNNDVLNCIQNWNKSLKINTF